MPTEISDTELQREQIDALIEPTVVEFGASWCGHCQAAAPFIIKALADFHQVRHVQIEDGPGRRLGRTFKVKLWPTLIFLHQGKEVARLVRPTDTAAIHQALQHCVNGD